MERKMEESVAERAADKLQKEAEDVAKLKGSGYPNGIKKEMAGPICSMLVRFCYQEDSFAEAVLAQSKKFSDCLEGIIKLSTREKPVVSDLDAYKEAVRFYIPDGKVTMRCRVVLPVERDDDLFDLGTLDKDQPGEAVILELPMDD